MFQGLLSSGYSSDLVANRSHEVLYRGNDEIHESINLYLDVITWARPVFIELG